MQGKEPKALRVVHELLQPQARRNPCTIGNDCEHLCIITATEEEALTVEGKLGYQVKKLCHFVEKRHKDYTLSTHLLFNLFLSHHSTYVVLYFVFT